MTEEKVLKLEKGLDLIYCYEAGGLAPGGSEVGPSAFNQVPRVLDYGTIR